MVTVIIFQASDVLGLYYGFERTFFNPPSAKVFSRSYALRKAVKINAVEATQMIDGVYCNSSSAAPSALAIARTSSVLPSRSAAKFQLHEDSLLRSKYRSFHGIIVAITHWFSVVNQEAQAWPYRPMPVFTRQYICFNAEYCRHLTELYLYKIGIIR
ncbi:hypothetical protein OIU76_024261 [Salix suchowensis]|nr:hypothetical protein OIU76_024261 [Salix suchowensis]